MSIIGLWQRKVGFGDRTSLAGAIRFCIGPRPTFGRLAARAKQAMVANTLSLAGERFEQPLM